MSDEGDRVCPLCAEEMDLTDQQLKPCKCGYEICVWCWHHIIAMAEKDQKQGRCPACRAPYNKEKIVGTTANCERLVAEMNMEKKIKSQKTKNKTSDGRKQLANVRVIQKNLVYIVGLPLTLADENLLRQRDYFGQYGRVLKVSISRTAAGSIQQFANDTCSVYITYSKEDEAVRCIQSVHGFVLVDSPLKACFGTTKYCHAWLRNVPCSNSECLYLHEFGTQEDSFTKDETVSAFTRNRVQQITSATCNLQRRSGNVLPPPADECRTSSSALTEKPTSKNTSNNIATNVNCFPPNNTSARSAALPSAASWGARASNGNPPSTNISCSNGLSKQNHETCSGSVAFSTKLINEEESQNKPLKVGQELLKNSSKQYSYTDTNGSHEAPRIHSPPSPKNNRIVSSQVENDNLCSGIESMCINKSLGENYSGNNNRNNSFSGIRANSSVNHGIQQSYADEFREPSTSISQTKTVASKIDTRDPKVQPSFEQEFFTRRKPETESNMQNFGAKSESQVASPNMRQHLQSLPSLSLHQSSQISSSLIQEPSIFDKNIKNGSLLQPSGITEVLNGYSGNMVKNYVDSQGKFEHTCLEDNFVGRSEVEERNTVQSVGTDIGESSIISNILSLDFDPWEESLASQNLVKMLGEGDEKQGPLVTSNSWKLQNSNKSRFSFARADEYRDIPSSAEPSFSHMQQVFKESPLSHDFAVNRDYNFDKFGGWNGFSTFNNEEPVNLAGNHSYLSSNNFSGPRSQVSAPPGFSSPNKPPPPGFTSYGRLGPNFEAATGNHFLDASSLSRNAYQSPLTGNISNITDIEFMDPAILAVGKGRFPIGANNGVGLDIRSNFSSHLNNIENEARFQSLMQRSSPPVQNLRYSNISNGFGPISDTHNHLPSRIMEQTLSSNLSPFSQLNIQQPKNSMMPNSQWNGWSEGKSPNNMGMAELLRSEGLGLNKFYGGYENSNFRMPSSGDLYNRRYGI